MGLFDSGNTGIVKGTQVLFKDNRHVKFRQLPIRHTCLCEMSPDNKEAVNCWRDYFNNRYVFNGYKGIQAGKATLSFQRDIVLNLNNIIPDDKLPKEGGDLTQHSDIAKSRIREVQIKTDKNSTDKITTALIISFIIFVLLLVVSFVRVNFA